MYLSVKTRKLTVYAALTGGMLTFCIYAGAGYVGVILLTAFFVLGSAATSFKFQEKKEMSIHEENQGRRSAGQVFANAGLAGIIGLVSLIFPENRSLCLLMIAAVFSSATSDTLSSELGNLYGKKYYNILTFKRDAKGLNGVVSIEGTLIGIAGSVIIAALYVLFIGWEREFYWIILAGTIGNFSDSILGASLERRSLLKNNSVNFISTAASVAVILILYF
ncbi:DUF92 domain-containing protein [Pedobacter sp. P351]|uniref:DUF92 domain-containing protein n=1 Tax=Pedobacter superstes TaxID=3133441 RepID=UPI0030A665A1